jgi:hypothetical protein
LILIEANRAGAMWLRAMFRYYCRKNNCQMFQLHPSVNVYYAEGINRVEAEFQYERAFASLQIRIINAIAKGKSKDARRITVETTREFVKNLYGIGGVSVQGN